MHRFPILIAAVLLLLPAGVQAQDYVSPAVEISSEKVNISGNVFFVHKVEAKQTVYSICKAYGISQEALLEANPSAKDGLRQGSLLYIPVRENGGAVLPAEPEPEASAVSRSPEPKWYEKIFGKRRSKPEPETSTETPVWEEGNVGLPEVPGQEQAVNQDIPQEESEIPAAAAPFNRDNPFRLAVVLPLDARQQPDDNYFDFYCGVLAALEELKDSGYDVALNVFDSKSENPLLNSAIGSSDAIIGPVHRSDIQQYLDFAGSRMIPLVSPMDQSVTSLVEGNPFLFQAPASESVQMVNMIQSLNPGPDDKIYVFYNSTLKEKELVDNIKFALDEAGIEYTNLAYDILKGRELGQRLGRQWSSHYTYKIIVASEDNAFAPDVVRNISLITRGSIKVETYCSNVVKGFENSLDYNTLHQANARISAPYYVDYDDPFTHSFILKYRALFHTEPTAFAFQGHDLASYFVTSLYNLDERLEDMTELEPQSLLQCKFHFVRDEKNNGWRNIATRNLIYNPDCSVTVEK